MARARRLRAAALVRRLFVSNEKGKFTGSGSILGAETGHVNDEWDFVVMSSNEPSLSGSVDTESLTSEQKKLVGSTGYGAHLLGRSVAAGKIAVFKTVTTRSCFLPIFPLVIPPLTMKALGAVAGLVPGSAAAIVAELSIITCSMSIGLPAALALAPLRMELDPTSLEPEFHALKGKDGKPMTTVYAAKGM